VGVLLVLAVVFITLYASEVNRHEKAKESKWDYMSHGYDWASMYSDCAGQEQSPIDIVDADTTSSTDLPTLTWPTDSVFTKKMSKGILMECSDNCATLEWDGVTYTLAQFHGHTLSEHYIDSVPANFELHFVFANTDEANVR